MQIFEKYNDAAKSYVIDAQDAATIKSLMSNIQNATVLMELYANEGNKLDARRMKVNIFRDTKKVSELLTIK